MRKHRDIYLHSIRMSVQCMSHSTKVKEFQHFFFAKTYTANLDLLNLNFNSEQLTAINHSFRQENLHNNACVELL